MSGRPKPVPPSTPLRTGCAICDAKSLPYCMCNSEDADSGEENTEKSMEEILTELQSQQIVGTHIVPAVSCASIEFKSGTIISTSYTHGQKDTQADVVDSNQVNNTTQFPASSLSKIVFTFLVLKLVAANHFDLDEALYSILPNPRFLINGQYPEKAKQLTARHVLSHTTGLPNIGTDLSSPLLFDPNLALGEGYAYSGEKLRKTQSTTSSQSILQTQPLIYKTQTEHTVALRQENTYHGRTHSVRALISSNAGFFKRLGDTYLETHRHEDDRIQHEYDKRFALVLKT